MSTLEAQIKAVADEAFDQTEPAVQPSNGAERNVWIDIEPVDLDTRRWAARPRRILAVVAAVLLVALVGGLLLATNPNSDPIPADDPNGLSVVELLSGLPLEIETQVDLVEGELIVGGVDLVALENVAGIERPGTVSGPWVELALGAEGAPVPQSALWSSGLSNPEAFEAELPFSALDVGRYVTVNVSGGGLIDGFDQFTLISEVDAVEAAVGEDNLLQVGEGEAGERRIKDRTTLRPIGRPLFVGLDPERDAVAVAVGADLVTAWLDADESLMTSSTGLVDVAEQLDRVDGLIGFQIFRRDFSTASLAAAGADDSVLDDFAIIDRPFSQLGIGWSGIGASRRIVYVYLFDDNDAASAATPSVEATFDPNTPLPAEGAPPQVMGSFFNIDSIETMGRTVVVTTRPTSAMESTGFYPPPPANLHR